MNHIRVKSSQIHSHGYDPQTKELATRFLCRCCNGEGHSAEGHHCGKCRGTGHTGTYTYAGVPPEEWALLREAADKGESIGKAHGQHIKKGGYKFTFEPHAA